MDSTKAFTVYNASAGAGKTYTLVKSYLITLLKGEYKESYKNILAITFTNKAVAEMKTRVLESLVGLSSKDTPAHYKDLQQDLQQETGFDVALLKKKASQLLKSILHNYAGFDIVTIDTFTHRVIRTFAKDLGIPMNFEIEMDVDDLLQESVDAVIAKVGSDPELTNIIIDFALSKLEDDKSWDITIELHKAAKLLYSENDRKHLAKLQDKKLKDFEELHIIIKNRSSFTRKSIIDIANSFFEIIKNAGIEEKDFKGGYIPKYFRKLLQGEIKFNFESVKWMYEFDTTDFYNKTLEISKKEIIDSLRPQITSCFFKTKEKITLLRFLENISKNLVPLAVLNTINQELQMLKKEKGILLISEFNKIISDTIKDQPAPFIYERLGERYRDYFIDEFQDTSELQWKNIIPLIDNALATETLTGKRGHLTIVGDAKQAIYRWRGGKAEQFIALSLDENPFSVPEKEVITLPRNYRSHQNIVKFNNELFTFLSEDFSDTTHQKIYELGNQQEYNSKKGGFVDISFIEAKTVEEENAIYPQRTYDIILELQEKGYELSDICILTRKQKEGSIIADFLSEKGIPIISSETLLLKNDPKICFLIDLLTWYAYPDNLLAKTRMLYFIADQISISGTHSFLREMVFADKTTLIKTLGANGILFDFGILHTKPFYEAVEYCIGVFHLAEANPAYLQFFLDVVFSYAQKHTDGVIGFLEYWEEKKDSLSIVSPLGENAITMMTIHKSKGLEFRCVIYPYANTDIYNEIEPKTWMPVDPMEFNGFEEVFLTYTKELTDFRDPGKNLVEKRQSQLELDALNLLYVALTRAEEQLYIISRLEINSKGESNTNKFSGKFIRFLQYKGLWIEGEQRFGFGVPEMQKSSQKETGERAKKLELSAFSSWQQQYKVKIVTNSGKLWDTSQGDAIEKGNLIHELMASIISHKDIDEVLRMAYESGQITFSDKELLHQEILKVISHPKLSKYFEEGNKVINERDIFCYGEIYRPDRVILDEKGGATLIDYKTGIFKSLHAKQLHKYSEIIESMGFIINEKILIYFDTEVYLKYV